MYSLTIHFGPNAMFWSFLFKEEKNASGVFDAIHECIVKVKSGTCLVDDFGQRALIELPIHGMLLEDMDLAEEARILRSLANARGEIKARQRASTDPIIRSAQNGPSVIAPNFRAQ